MNVIFEFENSYGKIIAGVDEAGRGPLAGPVVAAAVIIKKPELLTNVNDSKKISEKKREQLYDVIMENCVVGIGISEHSEIDEINILNATFKAMKKAVEKLNEKFDIVLVDGNMKIRDFDILQEPVVKGDGKSLAIAAASIVAKVTRDRMMIEMAEKYKSYGFEKHKGYGTAFHIERIREFGPCEIHRKSFIKNI